VRLNADLRRTHTGRLIAVKDGTVLEAPDEADPERPLDVRLAELSGLRHCGAQPSAEPVCEHIAARFRRALDEIEGEGRRVKGQGADQCARYARR